MTFFTGRQAFLGVMFATITGVISNCQPSNQTATVTFSPGPTGTPTASPSPTPTPTATPTPVPQATMPYQVMIGIDFACGSSTNGSLEYPNNASPALNANASLALNGTSPLIIIDEEPGQTQPYTPKCTPPTAWNAQYLLRFASYSDLVAQQAYINTGATGTATFTNVMYDNEPSASPQTNPSELPSSGGGNSVPGYYYYQFAQLTATLPGTPRFMGTAGTSGTTTQDNIMYGTSPYWGAWEAQSQQAGATVTGWINAWSGGASKVLGYNNVAGIYLGVGQVLAGTPKTEATQAQLDAVMANVPPNFSGVWMNCNAQSGVPNGYGLCAQAIVDTANGGVQATPYPIPASTSPPPAPPASPSYPATPTPTPTPPAVAATLCIGQPNGAGLQYVLANHDEFYADNALNTSSPQIVGDLNVSDTYPAASPLPYSGFPGGNQTTWSNQYSFGRFNGGLAGTDDSYYPSFAQMATWQSEYGATNYPSVLTFVPGTGVKLWAEPAALVNVTTSAAYTTHATILSANYTAGSTTVSVASSTGIVAGQYASIFYSGNFDANSPTVVSVSGSGPYTVTLSGTGFASSYVDNPGGGTQPIVFSPPTIKVSSTTGLQVGQVLSVLGTVYDNEDPTITAITGTTVSLGTGNGVGGAFAATHANGSLMSAMPSDIAAVLCQYGTCRHNLAGLMDANINNAYEYGYFVYGTASMPDGSSAYQGDYPSDWTLCETGCGAGNNYYELDTFEIFATLFGANYGRSTVQPENPSTQTNSVLGPGPVTGQQYVQFTDTTLASAPHTWAEVSAPNYVWFIKDNQTPSTLPLNQVPAASNPSFPGLNPIMVMQTCWWGSYCAPGVNPTSAPNSITESYYRHYSQSAGPVSCGPPFDVPPPPSPTPIPTAPPTTNPAVAPTRAAQSAVDFNSTGYGDLYGVLGTASGTTGSINSTNGYLLLWTSTNNGSVSLPTNWTSLVTPSAGNSQIAAAYCFVGTGSGQCPSANSWNFGGSSSGGLSHVFEFAQAGTPFVISATNSVSIYGTNTSASVPASLTIPSQNGLTLEVSGAFLAGATTTTVSSMTDSITGALTAGSAIDLYDANQTTGGGGSNIATLRVLSINQDAYLANAQPIVNTQAEITNTGGGISFSNYFIFIPHS